MREALAMMSRRQFPCVCLLAYLCLQPNGGLPSAAAQTELRVAGQMIERELTGGQTHAYDLKLEAGMFVEVTAEQIGINVSAALFTPDGRPIFTSDSHRGMRGIERICVIADSTGRYELKIQSVRRQAAPGRYLVKVTALRSATPEDSHRLMAQSLFAEADRLRLKGSPEQARKLYQQALAQWIAAGDEPRQALTLRQISALSGRLKLGREALEEGEQAAALYRALGDRSGEAHSLFTVAEGISWALKEPERAMQYYERSLDICREIEERLIEGLIQQKLAILSRLRGENEKALDFARQSLFVLQTAGEREDATVSFAELREICELLGNRTQAIIALQQARRLYLETGDSGMEAVVHSSIGKQAALLRTLSHANASLGRMQKAIEQSRESLRIQRELGNAAEEASGLQSLAEIYRQAGDRRQALEFCEQAHQLFHSLGDREGEIKALLLAGNLLHLLEEYPAALERLAQAVALSRSLQKPNHEAAAWYQSAPVYLAMGDREKAFDAYSRCLALARAVENRFLQADTLHNIGWTHLSAGKREKALEYHEQALRLYRELGDSVGEANALRGVGRTYGMLKQQQKGIELHRQAVTLSRTAGEPACESIALYDLALLQTAAGQLPQARESMEQAIALHETIRAELISADLRATYLASSFRYYEFYVDLLMRLHEQNNARGFDTEAFEASEKSRARALLELLAEARADLRQDVSAELVARETDLQERINEKMSALRKAGKNAAQAAELNRQVTSLQLDLRRVRDEIHKINPHLTPPTDSQPLRLPEIQNQLDSDTLLLEYALGDERSHLWAVTKDSIHAFRLPGRVAINRQARNAHKLLSDQQPQKPGETAEQWQRRFRLARRELPAAITELSRTVLGPVAPLLDRKRLVVVADGALQYIPFGALANGSKPLIVEHEIVNLPSASTISLLRRQSGARGAASGGVAVLADPVFAENDARLKLLADQATKKPVGAETSADLIRSARETGLLDERENLVRLPHTKTEAEAIAKAASGKTSPPATLATGFEASRQLAMSGALGQYRIVHFATHGFLNSRHPELSGLALSLFDREGRAQNGFLRLQDVYKLKLRADLVVLSACRTALGREISGEGLIGLTRGFMHAGAPRVVSSLWNVDDRATAELMKRFYAEMLGTKRLPPAAALRAAQVSMWSEPRWNQPYQWAAFVLQGEWR